jgi:transposase InsO family protein
VPFASPNAFFGLSRLSVWWLRLGIRIERMHLTLRKEATKPAAKNFQQQQAKFDHVVEYYNHERPHQRSR